MALFKYLSPFSSAKVQFVHPMDRLFQQSYAIHLKALKDKESQRAELEKEVIAWLDKMEPDYNKPLTITISHVVDKFDLPPQLAKHIYLTWLNIRANSRCLEEALKGKV